MDVRVEASQTLQSIACRLKCRLDVKRHVIVVRGLRYMTVPLGKLTELIMRLRTRNIALDGDFEIYAGFGVSFSSARQLGQVEKLLMVPLMPIFCAQESPGKGA